MRKEKIELIRNELSNEGISIGTWQQIPHASISEILGNSGYDWVAVDLEHGSISIEQLPDLFRAIELGGALPIARLAESNRKDCKQALDAGAGGVIVPMIESAEQLQSISDFCCWPPSGKRGVGFSRANLFGKNFVEYSKEAQAPLLIAQIENISALNNLDNILQVKGLDAIIIGPYDLSASMDITAEFEHNDFKKVLSQILEKCKQYNVACGYHIVQPDFNILNSKIKLGFRFIAFSIDSVFLLDSSKIDRNSL